MKNKDIFVACDTSNLTQINKILKNINTKKYFIKLILTFNFSYNQKRKKQAREACLLFIREKLI